MKILFFGTPQIAVPFLEELVKTHEVVGAVTQPDRPAARGQHMHAPPVKELAQKSSIPVFQPAKFEPELVEGLKKLSPDAGVVVSYGNLIPERVFTIPKNDCFNIHFSLLPKYRGAAPVQWALINGDRETGVCTFWIEKTLDSGPVLERRAIAIEPEDDFPSLIKKLIPLGLDAMNATLERLKNGKCQGVPQHGEPVLAPSLKKEQGRIDWNAHADTIINLMRGTRPWPGVYTIINEGKLKGTSLKILKMQKASHGSDEAGGPAPGRIAGVVKGRGFIVFCGDGYLLIEEVHPENKRPMSAWDFLQGAHFKTGDIIFI